MSDMEEIILVDKPEGMSSFGVVARVRRVLTEEMRRGGLGDAGRVLAEEGVREGRGGEIRGGLERGGSAKQRPKRVKVGHTGTLDPFATGLLVLLVGKGTKRANEFLKLDKEYVATVRLGANSTTGDPEGIITEHEVREKPNKEAVEKVVESLVGENWQKVPAFSAVKVNGQRAYRLAREGKVVETPTRKVEIYEIEILGYEWPELEIRCRVSSGTYIRTLGEEIGEKLGTGAYLTALRRTQVGEYRVEMAKGLGEFGIED